MGYAVSAPTGTSASYTVNAQFVKGSDPFNNGDIITPLLMKGGPANVGDYNLLGNPYPSAIDFNALSADSDNNNMEAAYSLWTNCAGLSGNAHQDTGYTTYSVSGTNTAACSGNGGTAQAGQYIATGQGFMVKANADNSTVTFKNSFRVTGNNNGFLNRSTNRNVAWIDMKTDIGKFSQIAVGFYPEATDAYDRNFDAHSMNTGSGFALYSLVNNEKLAIQGLAQLNGDEKVVSLGIESDAERMVTIHLNRIEGLSDIYIYLQDLDLNIIHDLTATDYTTTLHEGQSDSRFKLIFTRQALNQKELKIDPNTVLLIQNDGIFNLKAQDHHRITALTVFDINGRIIFNRKALYTNFYKINLKRIATGNLLLFKIELDQKNYLVKKALKN